MSALLIRPLTLEALAPVQALLQEACAFDKAHAVAQEKLFGDAANGCTSEVFGAFAGDVLVGIAATSDRWIRILAVAPNYRKQGIGTSLLKASLRQIAASSEQARTMDQPGNYLSPGIDTANAETITWLQRRGFSKCGEACNLLIDLQENDRVSESSLQERTKAVEAAGYRIARIRPEELETCAAMIEKEFSSGWAFELRRACMASPAGVHLARLADTEEVVAFAVHDGNNQGLGSFGPTGTLPAHRGKGLGAALLLACLLDIQRDGHERAEVAWIGPRDFYDKIAGIKSERQFTIMSKPLTEEDKND